MKKILFVITLLIGSLAKIAASPAAINFDNLPKNDKFQSLLLDFGNAYEAIKFPYVQSKALNVQAPSRATELEAAKKLYEFLEKQKKSNYDMEVLKLLTMRCLYNFDELNSSKMEKEFSRINKKYSKNAEHHWVYGNFLVTAGKPVDGMKELEKYLDMKNGMIGSFFIYDYAYAQFLSNMPLSAYYTITNGGSIPEKEIDNVQLLNLIKNLIKESSSSETYTKEQVWKVSQKKDEWNYVYSTMLGISIPCKDNWGLKLQPFTSKTPAVCILNPNDFSVAGNKVGISVLLLAYPESLYDDSVKQNYVNMFNTKGRSIVKISDNDFEKYEIEDLSRYNDVRKGARCYLYISKIQPNKYAGAMCEHSFDFSSIKKDNHSNEPSYFKFEPAQNRLNEPVNIIILVDSCNALAEETDKLLEDMFKRSVFK